MSHSIQHIRTPQFGGSVMAATLQGEARMHANCFRIRGDGRVEEGIQLELSHPKVGGKPALFVGDYFILRDNRCGVAYTKNGIVRRAQMKYLPRNGKKDLELLVQPTSKNPPLLVHVETSPVLADRARLKYEFQADIQTTGGIIATALGEYFISLTDDESITVFCVDGTVRDFVQKDYVLTERLLSFEEQADARIRLVQFQLERASDSFSGDALIRRRDWLYHQLITILQVGARSESVFEQVFGILEDAKQHDLIALGVQNRLLSFLEDEHRWRFLATESISSSAGEKSRSSGVPAERRAKLAARAAANRARRNVNSGGGQTETKGPTNPKSIRKRQKAHEVAARRKK